MKVDGSLKSLLQGVSQQGARDRLPGQCTEQINMSADPVNGLTRRPPTDLVGALVTTGALRGFHDFQTKSGSKFLAQFRDGAVSVTDYNATPITTTIDSDAIAYITTPGEFAYGTVDNQVIVVNRSIIPAMTTDLKAYANKGTGSSPMGIIQVLGGQYGREYRINMNGTTIALYKPPNGSAAAMIDYVRTTSIASRLFESMTTSGADVVDGDGTGSLLKKYGTLASGYTVTRFEDCILIKKNTAGTFTLSCSDDQGQVNLKTMTETCPASQDLPRIAPHKYLARIATETDPEEDLFLEFILEGSDGSTAIGSGFGSPGYWQEAVSSAVKYKLDTATMPHVLEYTPGTNSFKFRRGNWKDRAVGTDISNPQPSFIGNTINDVTTFQSRLVFLTGSFVCMSRTNRFEDFWMGSAASLVDSDPIDISSTAVEASIMRAAVPHNRDLVVFSQKGQFVVFGRSALTPANATLVLTTAFEAELAAKPVPAGRNVFFATTYGRYTGIREFYTQGSTEINDTRPITQHVKNYLEGKIKKLSSTSNYDTLIVITDHISNSNPLDFYTYQYVWNDQDKVQSAWGTWRLSHQVEYCFFDEELIYFVCRKSNTPTPTSDYFLYRMSLDISDDTGIGYPLHLDGRFDIPDCYTSFILPYNRLNTETLRVVQSTGCPNPGMLAEIDSIVYQVGPANWLVTLKTSMLGGDLVVGIPFLSSYRPTMPLVKDQDGIVMATAKLKAKGFIVSIEDTGDINGQLLSKYGDGEVVSFQGRILNDPENQVGVTALSSDAFFMPFREDTRRADFVLFTDRHLPMNLLEIEWVGQYQKRGRRIGTGGKQ